MDYITKGIVLKKRCFIAVAPDPSHGVPPNPGGQLTASIGLKRFADEQGIELLYLDTTQSSFPVPGLGTRLLRGAHRMAGFIRLAVTHRPDGAILFASAGFSFFERGAMALLAKPLGVPTLLNLRSGHIQSLFAKPGMKQRVARKMLNAPTWLGVQGENWLEFVQEAGGPLARTRVLRNWISPDTVLSEIPRCHDPDRPVTFCFVGWMVREKGVNEILAAAKDLRAARKSFRIVLIGGGTLLESLKNEVAEGGLSEKICLAGWRDHSDVLADLARTDVFILPTYDEGFPNALLEAMTLGLPAISTPVGGIPDSLKDGHNGFLVPPRDSGALAVAMARYIDTPDLIAKHSAATLNMVNVHHDFRKNCLAMFGVFDDPTAIVLKSNN